MMQQINVHWNNSDTIQHDYLLCRNSEAIHLAQLGVTAGWLADKIWVNFDF